MATKHQEFFASLMAPFYPPQVRVLSKGGRNLSYITARAVQNRLDDVCGPENWWTEFIPAQNSVQCKLTIVLPDGSVVTKSDAGGYAGMADQGDDDKSGYSDAIKRAACMWGIGRGLYGDGMPSFVEGGGEVPNEHRDQPYRDQPQRQQSPPSRDAGRGQPEPQRPGGGQNYGDRPPTNGRGLFAALKKIDEQHGGDWVKFANNLAKQNGIEGRLVDFSPEQVAYVYGEVQRKLSPSRPAPQTVPAGGDQSDPDDDDVPF